MGASRSDSDEFQTEDLFAPLRDVPGRRPLAAASGRAQFLEQAKAMQPAAVSAAPEGRHKGWIQIFHRKEPKPMTTLATVFLVITLLFGGAGATVQAAQDSMPGQALYQVKLVSEDARLGVATQAQTRLALALEYSSRRAAEAAQQIQAGDALQSRVTDRWQQELQLALNTAAGLPDSDLQSALDQIRLAVQDQQRLMDQLHASAALEPDQLRIRQMLRDCEAMVQLGVKEPEQFRQQVRQSRDITPGPAQPSQAAGGGNPWTTGTPAPGSSYGPGGQNPWTTGTPTPGSGYGPGGQNPWTTGTPTPGSGYGPGPGPGLTCTPNSGPGPYATSNPGPNNPNPGPVNPDPGPSNPDPGPTNPDPGPSNPEPGPTNPDPGPSNPSPGPGTGGKGK